METSSLYIRIFMVEPKTASTAMQAAFNASAISFGCSLPDQVQAKLHH